MGEMLTTDAPTTSGHPRGMTAGAWARGVFALAAVAAFTVVLVADIGYVMEADWQLRYREWVTSSADAVNRAVGGEFVRSGSAFIRVPAGGGSATSLAQETVSGWIGTIPTAAVGVAIATLFAARTRRLGWKVATGLVALGVLLAAGAWPLVSGALQGLGIGLADGLGAGYVWDVQRWLRDVSPVLVCAVVAGTWWAASWIRRTSDEGPIPFASGRPEHAWWAVGMSWTAAVVACPTAVAAIGDAATITLEGQWLNAARVTVCGVLLVATAVMATVALVRGRGSRYGWVPAALAGLTGGEAAGGLVLLLMVVLRMDVQKPSGSGAADVEKEQFR